MSRSACSSRPIHVSGVRRWQGREREPAHLVYDLNSRLPLRFLHKRQRARRGDHAGADRARGRARVDEDCRERGTAGLRVSSWAIAGMSLSGGETHRRQSHAGKRCRRDRSRAARAARVCQGGQSSRSSCRGPVSIQTHGKVIIGPSGSKRPPAVTANAPSAQSGSALLAEPRARH